MLEDSAEERSPTAPTDLLVPVMKGIPGRCQELRPKNPPLLAEENRVDNSHAKVAPLEWVRLHGRKLCQMGEALNLKGNQAYQGEGDGLHAEKGSQHWRCAAGRPKTWLWGMDKCDHPGLSLSGQYQMMERDLKMRLEILDLVQEEPQHLLMANGGRLLSEGNCQSSPWYDSLSRPWRMTT